MDLEGAFAPEGTPGLCRGRRLRPPRERSERAALRARTLVSLSHSAETFLRVAHAKTHSAAPARILPCITMEL